MSCGEYALTSHSVEHCEVLLGIFENHSLRTFAHWFLPFYLHSELRFSRRRNQREVGRRGKGKKGGHLVDLKKLTHGLER